MLLHLKCLRKQDRAVDVSIPMNLAVTKEAAVLKSRNQAEHACLVCESQMILKSDQIVRIRAQIFLSQLDDRVGLSASPGITQANGFHRSKAQCVAASAGNLLDWQTSLEVVEFLPIALVDRLRRYQCIIEAVILFASHRAVDV